MLTSAKGTSGGASNYGSGFLPTSYGGIPLRSSGDPKQAGYARNCMLARRLLERGVRFVQLFHEASDQHGDLTKGVKKNCEDTQQASAALVMDLKERGLLDDTIVIWGGEFGRTPMVQGGNDGRDHHNRAFTMWLAGGGIKAGHVHGHLVKGILA